MCLSNRFDVQSASNGVGTGETSVLQDRSVTVRSGRDDTDVRRVLDGSEDSCGQDDLLVGLADVDNIDTCRVARMSLSSKRTVRDVEDAGLGDAGRIAIPY